MNNEERLAQINKSGNTSPRDLATLKYLRSLHNRQVSSKKATIKRRAKNKVASKSRKINRTH